MSLQVDPIIIYTMGKVGSISLYEALTALKLDHPIYHTHNLTEDDIAKLQEAIDNEIDVVRLSKKIEEIKQLRQLVYARDGQRCKVITLVRDPIAWAISALFQSIERKFPDLNLEDDPSINLEKAQQIFEHRQEDLYTLASTWFDTKIKNVFGIDVFSTDDFPKAKGYNIYQGEHADLLLIRLESLNSCYYNALKEFLNIDLLDLPYKNTASDKTYQSLYHTFVKSVNLSPGFIERMCAMQYVQYFYSQEEIEWFKLKWGDPRVRKEIERIRAETKQHYKFKFEDWKVQAEHWKTEAQAAKARVEHWKTEAQAAKARAEHWKTEAKLGTISRIKRQIRRRIANVLGLNTYVSTEQNFRD
ncbi:MAG: hypothetical protein HS114_21060 [Anaerolineales bacterium]|nr:hypothetical protein [Anaerolineales bacterium]